MDKEIKNMLGHLRETIDGVDIPSPTCPEYIEHHRAIKIILSELDEILKIPTKAVVPVIDEDAVLKEYAEDVFEEFLQIIRFEHKITLKDVADILQIEHPDEPKSVGEEHKGTMHVCSSWCTEGYKKIAHVHFYGGKAELVYAQNIQEFSSTVPIDSITDIWPEKEGKIL